MNIYTKTGDNGQSGLIGGTRVSKSHIRLDAYGNIDELNAQLALLREYLNSEHRKEHIIDIQTHLFRIGAQLATAPDARHQNLWERYEEISKITKVKIQEMETEIDLIDASLPPQQAFIIPGGNKATAQCHICRCVCRRAERICVALHELSPIDEQILKYLNRLSDFLFVLSRKLCLNECEELFWNGK